VINAAEFTQTITVAEVMEAYSSRVYSDTWNVPDELFSTTLGELRGWAEETFADPVARHTLKRRFLLDVARF
jgi:hypothetical protein